MDFERLCPPVDLRNVEYRRSKPISRSLDGVAKPLESVPWRHVEHETERSPPFLTLYTNKPVPTYQKSEPEIKPDSLVRIPVFDNYRMPDTPRPRFAPLPPCECCDRDHKPRPLMMNKTTRILAWLKDVEPANHGPWVSFLPTCESSNGSDLSLGSVQYFAVETRVDPEPTSFVPILDEDSSREESTDEMDTWPYDGRGLYEHHSRYECGLACYVACRRRRKLRAVFGIGKVLTRMLPWMSAKEGSVMSNSDVPHPPWWISYRSNDDALGEDDEDGDLELWLEHMSQKHLFHYDLRFQLALNQKPDSRIFSSWSE